MSEVELSTGAVLIGALIIGLAVIIGSMINFISVDPNLETAVDDGALVTIDFAHYEIHEGEHYKAGFQDISMDDDDIIELIFVTSNTTTWDHWVLVAQSTGAVYIDVYEDVVTSSDGTPVVVYNRNRNSLKVSNTSVYKNPVITSNGTKISTRWLGSEGFKEDTGASERGESELILKQNTKYLVRLTAISDGIVGAIGGDWYEHTDKH